MKEKIIMIVFCFVIFGISISTLFNQTIFLFKKDEKVSDVVKGHELETKKDKSGVKGAVDSFTSNLTGKKKVQKQLVKSQRRLQEIRILNPHRYYLEKRIGYSINLQRMGILFQIIRVQIIMMRLLCRQLQIN